MKVIDYIEDQIKKGNLYSTSYVDLANILKESSYLFYGFKDSTKEIIYSDGGSDFYTKEISPLFYESVIDAKENQNLLDIITSELPFYYLTPSMYKDNYLEQTLSDTRDVGVNNVASILQESDFYETWFRDSFGYVQNEILLDSYNKLRYPYINENQYLDAKIFVKLVKKAFDESPDAECRIQFEDDDDYINDIIDQKVVSNYSFIDYTSEQSNFLTSIIESMYQSGQVTKTEGYTEKLIFKLQEIKNELLRRKLSGTYALYKLALASINRNGSFIGIVKASDINTSETVSFNEQGKISGSVKSYNEDRPVRIVNAPGLITEFIDDFDKTIDPIYTYYTSQDDYDKIPLKILTPIYYTSSDILKPNTLDKRYDYNVETFYTLGYTKPENKNEYVSVKNTETAPNVTAYDSYFLRDNANVVPWSNLEGVISQKSLIEYNDTLDMYELNDDGTYSVKTLDSKYLDENNNKIQYHLDIKSSIIDLKTVYSNVLDINADHLLFHSNSIQQQFGTYYDYLTYPIADGNSVCLMDTFWLNYIEYQLNNKTKVNDNTLYGIQLSKFIDLESSKLTTYNFFGISYSNTDDPEEVLKVYAYDDPKFINDPIKYVLLWYCTIVYNVNDFSVLRVEKQLISRITLKSEAPGEFYEDPSTKLILKSEYADCEIFTKYNVGVLPFTYKSLINDKISNLLLGFYKKQTYVLTEDTVVDPDKKYYKYNLKTYEYELVVSPSGNPKEQRYYEITITNVFYDDAAQQGFAKTMFVFSKYDITKLASDKDIDPAKIDETTSIFTNTFNSNVKTLYYVVKKLEKEEYSNVTNTSGALVYDEDGKLSVSEYKDVYRWSDPVNVINLKSSYTSEDITESLVNNHFTPDWYGLTYQLNPYLNFVTQSASALRHKTVNKSYNLDKTSTHYIENDPRYNYKGSVDTYIDLPNKIGVDDGAIYFVTKQNCYYIFNKTQNTWIIFSNLNTTEGPSDESALANLTRIHRLDFVANDSGEKAPTHWIDPKYYKEYEISEDHPAMEVYGVYLNKTQPDSIDRTESFSEYSIICGDNRDKDIFDVQYTSIEYYQGDDYKTALPDVSQAKENVLYVLVKSSGEQNYFIYSSKHGKYIQINDSDLNQRSTIYYNDVLKMPAISIQKDETSSDKKYFNYLKLTPCKETELNREEIFFSNITSLKDFPTPTSDIINKFHSFINPTNEQKEYYLYNEDLKIFVESEDYENDKINKELVVESKNNWYWNNTSNDGLTVCLNATISNFNNYIPATDKFSEDKEYFIKNDDNVYVSIRPTDYPKEIKTTDNLYVKAYSLSTGEYVSGTDYYEQKGTGTKIDPYYYVYKDIKQEEYEPNKYYTYNNKYTKVVSGYYSPNLTYYLKDGSYYSEIQVPESYYGNEISTNSILTIVANEAKIKVGDDIVENTYCIKIGSNYEFVSGKFKEDTKYFKITKTIAHGRFDKEINYYEHGYVIYYQKTSELGTEIPAFYTLKDGVYTIIEDGHFERNTIYYKRKDSSGLTPTYEKYIPLESEINKAIPVYYISINGEYIVANGLFSKSEVYFTRTGYNIYDVYNLYNKNIPTGYYVKNTDIDEKTLLERISNKTYINSEFSLKLKTVDNANKATVNFYFYPTGCSDYSWVCKSNEIDLEDTLSSNFRISASIFTVPFIKDGTTYNKITMSVIVNNSLSSNVFYSKHDGHAYKLIDNILVDDPQHTYSSKSTATYSFIRYRNGDHASFIPGLPIKYYIDERNRNNLSDIIMFTSLYEENDQIVQKNNFFGDIFDLRLYNKGKSPEELKILNLGMMRELYSYSPSIYKLAYTVYKDNGIFKIVDNTQDNKDIKHIGAVRIFNRSVWDSVLVDNYPVSEEEMDETSPQYYLYYKNPRYDSDVYARNIDIAGKKEYYLNDCVEQTLLDKIEVFNGRVIQQNTQLLYDNKYYTLLTDDKISAVLSLIQPVNYDNKDMGEHSYRFVLNGNTFYQNTTTDVDNYIKIYLKQDASDDYFRYSTDVIPNLCMSSEFNLSTWLSRGTNVSIVYDKLVNDCFVTVSDTSIKNSEVNNLVVPLVIPKQDADGMEKQVNGYLDRFNISNFKLNDYFIKMLRATSYYTELRVPMACKKKGTEYTLTEDYIIGDVIPAIYTKNYKLTEDEVYKNNKSYYTRENKGTRTDPYVYNQIDTTSKIGMIIEGEVFDENTLEPYVRAVGLYEPSTTYYFKFEDNFIEYEDWVAWSEIPAYYVYKECYVSATETSPVKDRIYYVKENNVYREVTDVKATDNPKEKNWYYKEFKYVFAEGTFKEDIKYYIYDVPEQFGFYNKWDGIRVLKEGTYYFTNKYPIKILPFNDDEFDSSAKYNYATLYASSRFKIEVSSSIKNLTKDEEDSYSIYGIPMKYQSTKIISTLKSSSELVDPKDNKTFPHKEIHIKLYSLDVANTKSKLAGYMSPTYTLATETLPVENRVYYKLESGEYVPVLDVKSSDNPSEKGWYYMSNEYEEQYDFSWKLIGSNDYLDCHVLNYELTKDTEIDEDKCYFEKIADGYVLVVNPVKENLNIYYECSYVNNGITYLNKENLDNGCIINEKVAMFFSKNYTLPFFVAGQVKTEDDESFMIDSTSADDDLIEPIKIKVNFEKNNNKEEKIITNSVDESDYLCLIAGKTYKILFDYTAKVSECAYYNSNSNGRFDNNVISPEEKQTYSRYYSLIDSLSVLDSDFEYITDGESFNIEKSTYCDYNSGFDSVMEYNKTEDFKVGTPIPENTYYVLNELNEYRVATGRFKSDTNYYKYTGSLVNKQINVSNRTYYFGDYDSQLSEKNALYELLTDSSNARNNINNSYKIYYLSHYDNDVRMIYSKVDDNVKPIAKARINSYIAYKSRTGVCETVDKFNEAEIIKYHYGNLLNIDSVYKLQSSSVGLISGFTKVTPNVTYRDINDVSSESKLANLKKYAEIYPDTHELYAYQASSRIVPYRNTYSITRTSLFKNNLLKGNQLNLLNNNYWTILGKYENLEEIEDEDFKKTVVKFTDVQNIEMWYDGGNYILNARYEVAINIKFKDLATASKIDYVKAYFYDDKNNLVNKNGLQLCVDKDSSDLIRNYHASTNESYQTSKIKFEINIAMGYVKSLETEIDKTKKYYKYENYNYVEVELKRDEKGQIIDERIPVEEDWYYYDTNKIDLIIGKIIVRGDGTTTVNVGLANSYYNNSFVDNNIIIASHAIPVLKDLETEQYLPIQFKNQSVNAYTLSRPDIGINRASTFINNNYLGGYGNKSKIKKLCIPWIRRFYYTHAYDESENVFGTNAYFHKYEIKRDSLDSKSYKETFSEVNDIFYLTPNEDGTVSPSKCFICERLPETENSNFYRLVIGATPESGKKVYGIDIALSNDKTLTYFGNNLMINEKDPITFSNEKLSLTYNCFNLDNYRQGISSPTVVTNIQILNDELENEKGAYDNREVLYELEYLPVIYDELKHHLSINFMIKR